MPNSEELSAVEAAISGGEEELPTKRPFHQKAVSSEHFEDLKAELKRTTKELEQLKLNAGAEGEIEPSIDDLTPEEALAVLSEDPVQFIREVVGESASEHLTDLKEEAELNAALRVARDSKPEFQRFERFILEEVAELIVNDADGVIEPWPSLLEKAYSQFESKFKKTLEEHPGLIESKLPNPKTAVLLEGVTSRKKRKGTPRFTRKQIGSMSIKDFISNESEINDALKNNRII